MRCLNILLQEEFAGARKIQLLQTGSTFLSPPPVSNVSCLFLHSCPCREQLGLHFSSHLLLASASHFSLKKWEKLQGKTSLPFLAGSQGTGTDPDGMAGHGEEQDTVMCRVNVPLAGACSHPRIRLLPDPEQRIRFFCCCPCVSVQYPAPQRSYFKVN